MLKKNNQPSSLWILPTLSIVLLSILIVKFILLCYLEYVRRSFLFLIIIRPQRILCKALWVSRRWGWTVWTIRSVCKHFAICYITLNDL